MMQQIVSDIGLWILLAVEGIFLLLALSFFLFGGRVSWSIELKGPLRFFSKKEDE